MKRKFKLLVFIMSVVVIMCGLSSTAFAKTSVNNTLQIIGRYDGPLSGVIKSNGSSAPLLTDSLVNVRINSYATYSQSDGITVYITLYSPSTLANPQFTSMSGTVSVAMNNDTTICGFAEEADGTSTISTDVDMEVMGNSGDVGQITVSGTATALNAVFNGGAFAITYQVTIP